MGQLVAWPKIKRGIAWEKMSSVIAVMCLTKNRHAYVLLMNSVQNVLVVKQIVLFVYAMTQVYVPHTPYAQNHQYARKTPTVLQKEHA